MKATQVILIVLFIALVIGLVMWYRKKKRDESLVIGEENLSQAVSEISNPEAKMNMSEVDMNNSVIV